MNRNPFKGFRREQWALLIVTAIVNVLLCLVGWSKIGGIISIAIVLTISLIGYFAAVWGGKLIFLVDFVVKKIDPQLCKIDEDTKQIVNDLTSLANFVVRKIDLQLRKVDEDTKQISDNLEYFIDLAKQEEKKKALKKGLNGVKQILDYKGVEEVAIRSRVLNALNRKWERFISASTFGPAEWMDPYWFSYLALQIARAAELKSAGITAKRYFVYKTETVEEYREELKLLTESHGNYVEPFLFCLEHIEEGLKDAGVELMDFAFIEYSSDDKLVLWRNLNKDGMVEFVTDPAIIQSIEGIIRFFGSIEETHDVKKDL